MCTQSSRKQGGFNWSLQHLEPGEVLVLAKFGCDLVEAAPLAL